VVGDRRVRVGDCSLDGGRAHSLLLIFRHVGLIGRGVCNSNLCLDSSSG
jgi:hypothetical protein